ncbi:MAG: hypothetical protein ACFCD0_22295 [Gemmataceae bacterium]
MGWRDKLKEKAGKLKQNAKIVGKLVEDRLPPDVQAKLNRLKRNAEKAKNTAKKTKEAIKSAPETIKAMRKLMSYAAVALVLAGKYKKKLIIEKVKVDATIKLMPQLADPKIKGKVSNAASSLNHVARTHLNYLRAWKRFKVETPDVKGIKDALKPVKQKEADLRKAYDKYKKDKKKAIDDIKKSPKNAMFGKLIQEWAAAEREVLKAMEKIEENTKKTEKYKPETPK